jgi:hypothetical protein
VVLDAQWYRQDYRGSERADKTTQSELSLERQIRRTLIGVIAYGWLDRNSNEEEFQYDRNLVSIGVRAEF